ncbi:glutaminyl-peptide cyclotransferase [Venturia canescens]|uniref:glutaminyl-peptide cyclotransferase n=1 Tax=Venturia canescens TaxID=32260 RepID=UPI001C9D25ED|nr:glutaminyl-peptide cyclotransferase [Venturia canescens]
MLPLSSVQYLRDSRSSNIMVSSMMRLCLTILVPCITAQETYVTNSPLRTERILHSASDLNENQLARIAGMTNIRHMNEVLDKICIPRVVGSSGHKKVKKYLKDSMKSLGWTVETDTFTEETPNLGILEFENIIAKLDPEAKRYLVLACHYDSLYTREGNFVGAIDSAVPCAQLLNLATVMQESLGSLKNSNVSLMFIFFDGEEAFKKWGPSDSIYGARHLVSKWKDISSYRLDPKMSDLDRIDILVLLDLLGSSNPMFYNYFKNTTRWYFQLVKAERALARMHKFQNYTYGLPEPEYFKAYPEHVSYAVEDDHIPFLRKNVPIIHLIPYGFPSFWHTPDDNRSIVDMQTTENLNKILRVFVASYLHLNI